MAISGGFGVVWQITVSASLTTVANVEEISFPVIEAEEVDVTAHDSTGGYAEFVASGRKLPTMFEATITWDTASESTHAELVTLRGSGADNAMTIADPGGVETLSFNGQVRKIERESPQDGAYRVKVTVRVNGEITIS